jgi:hypothetical protein
MCERRERSAVCDHWSKLPGVLSTAQLRPRAGRMPSQKRMRLSLMQIGPDHRILWRDPKVRQYLQTRSLSPDYADYTDYERKRRVVSVRTLSQFMDRFTYKPWILLEIAI